MKKRFKARKRKLKHRLIKLLFLIIFIILIYNTLIKLLSHMKLMITNKDLIEILIKDSNHHLVNNDNSIVKVAFNQIKESDIIKPINMLEGSYYYKNETASDNQFIVENTNFIRNTKEETKENARVYLYNTHQLEGYNKENNKDYKTKPSVMMASYILKENLNKKNIKTIVEQGDITTFLNGNHWDYTKSYKASRYFVKDTLEKNKNLELIIDIHRDSVSKSASTVYIDGKAYAKVLFVIGLEHNNYKKNLNVANKLNDIIKQKYPSLTRGVLKKEGLNVNGIYNQDLNENMILLECGGYQNKIEEVNNTMILLSDVIKEYLEAK